MKFHFNGGLDCPEWVLSQISRISKISLNEFKELCSKIVENFENKTDRWEEIKFSFNDNSANGLRISKAIIATLSFILEKATKYDCEKDDLEAEMLQLGLPAEYPFKAPPIKISSIEKLQTNEGEEQQFLLATKEEIKFTIEEELLLKLKKDMGAALKQFETFS
uniref:COMM domain-containing protein n=1 Tax=Meloidogyne javanica TaxID=6303 RepID=A0A915MKC8_MELJA